jgi:adenylate cyclase
MFQRYSENNSFHTFHIFIVNLNVKFFAQLSLIRHTLPGGYAIAGIMIVGLLLWVRGLGALQPLELVVYDQMVRWQPNPGPDPRLLVVGITESDIRQFSWPLSDRILAEVLAKLQTFRPAAIGLDIVRDIPVADRPEKQKADYEQFVGQLQQPNLIGITFIGSNDDDTIPPPPSLPPEQVGFSDVLIDPDGTVRRNLMFARQGETILPSFSLQLALKYLAEQKQISPQLTDSQDYQLNQKIFKRLTPNSGGYQNLDAGGYQILLNYRDRQIAETVTLQQLIEGQIDPNLVKDKIVLIGSTAASVKDSFFTPYSAGEAEKAKMFGVFVHAQMISQFLGAALDDLPTFWYWPEWVEVFWLVVWIFIGGAIAGVTNQPLILALRLGVSFAVLFASSFGLFLIGGWIPVVAPALGFLLAIGSTITYRFQYVRQQQNMVMKLLGQQTSPEIAEKLWNARDRLLQSGVLPGQTLTVTVLFTDIKDFTTISEENSSELLMSWLNEYMSGMTQEVINHHGIINKFIGDAVMAVFGVPIPRTIQGEIAADARNAVNCALAMGDRLRELNQSWRDRGLPQIQIRAGIFTGPVTVGSLGGKERLEYAIIGDTVNIASRLESCEKHRQDPHTVCRIIIARQTLSYIYGEFEVESWGPIALKGKTKTVDVYKVIGRKSSI